MRPILRAALTSGSLYILGDVVNQKLLLKRDRLDWGQTGRFGLVGFTLHGPYFLGGFKVLDRLYGINNAVDFHPYVHALICQIHIRRNGTISFDCIAKEHFWSTFSFPSLCTSHAFLHIHFGDERHSACYIKD